MNRDAELITAVHTVVPIEPGSAGSESPNHSSNASATTVPINKFPAASLIGGLNAIYRELIRWLRMISDQNGSL